MLLLNDLYLKAAYRNWITGKLSDFSGVFMVSMLVFAFLVNFRWVVGLLIACLFALWKSPLAEPAIKFIQSQGVFHFGRVVDYSDLVAIVMIPLAVAITNNSRYTRITASTFRRALTVPVVVLALFAVMGTSYLIMDQRYSIRKADEFPCPDPEEVMASIGKVADAHGLKPIGTKSLSRKSSGETIWGLEYEGDHIRMSCRVDEHGSAEFFVVGVPSGLFFVRYPERKMEEIKQALMSELGNKFKNMEFVIPLQKE
jgi:hypothetical protein